jgi:DNA polymerase III gamma/tau subunit
MPLHLTHRPNNLDEFFGNESLKESIASILARQDRPRAFLLTGPSGCGKTTLARIISKEINCSDPDYSERNVSDTRGIDDARKMIQDMLYMPREGDVKVYCLDEVQGATAAFQESILKALEDTPKHVTFILCTTDPQKLKKTIKTRCSQFEVRPLPGPMMTDFIGSILDKEFGQERAIFPDEFFSAIVEAADGCPRQALVILDQVIDLQDFDKMIEAIKRTRPSEASLKELMNKLLSKAPWPKVAEVLKAMDQAGEEWESLRLGVLAWAYSVMLNKGQEQAAKILHHFQEPLFHDGKYLFALYCWKCLL